MRTDRQIRARLVLPATLLVLVALVALLPDTATTLAWLAPALVLFATLSLGCYPAETLLRAAALKQSGRPLASVVARPSRPPVDAPLRGGLLLAYRLAGRAPPPGRLSQCGYFAV